MLCLLSLREDALRDMHAPAGRIIESSVLNVLDRTDFNIPKPEALTKVVMMTMTLFARIF